MCYWIGLDEQIESEKGENQRECRCQNGLWNVATAWLRSVTGKQKWNPYYEICNCTTKSIVYPSYFHTTVYPHYGNIQLLWIPKIHSISNKGPYNFHSMTLYGFSTFFPVCLDNQLHILYECPSCFTCLKVEVLLFWVLTFSSCNKVDEANRLATSCCNKSEYRLRVASC